jgi:hypothetical protein
MKCNTFDKRIWRSFVIDTFIEGDNAKARGSLLRQSITLKPHAPAIQGGSEMRGDRSRQTFCCR